jgi:hypothetical protein
MVAAQILPPERVLVHQLDLSYGILGWSSFLQNGQALKDKFGEKDGFHYSTREDPVRPSRNRLTYEPVGCVELAMTHRSAQLPGASSRRTLLATTSESIRR